MTRTAGLTADVAAAIDDALARRLAEHERRRSIRQADRTRRAAARTGGLRARHARKLQPRRPRVKPLNDTDLIDIAVTLAPGDGECIRCGEYFPIHGTFAMWRGGEVCTDCAPPDIAQAVAALDELHEVITIGDVSSRNRRALADTLRNLARLADQITSGERTVHKAIDLSAGPWSNNEPCGVHLDWWIDSTPPRTQSTAPTVPPGHQA